jgi:hypothetical protein
VPDDFERRLAAARDRVLAKRDAAERNRLVVLDAIRDWEARLLPLITEVVQVANPVLRGSGRQLALSQEYSHNVLLKYVKEAEVGLPSVSIFMTPEFDSDTNVFDYRDAHLQIGVGDGGDILTLKHSKNSETWLLQAPDRTEPFQSFDRQHVEMAIADLVDTIIE